MNTMTIPPRTYEYVIGDSERFDNNMSIEKLFLENTNTTNIKTNKTIIDILTDYLTQKEYEEVELNRNSIGDSTARKYFYTKKQIKIDENMYEFINEFIYTIIFKDNAYIAENELFNIFGYGKSIYEAENELFESIDDLWNVYVEENDDNLDKSALELKFKLINNIRKIQ